jgi:uncharacterized protein (DUF1800 family)
MPAKMSNEAEGMSMRSKAAVLTAVAVATILAARQGVDSTRVTAAALPSDDQAILHVLNRVGFGPAPGDVEKVRSMGLQQYIEQQLYPERIADAGMSARLTEFTTLTLSQREIAEQYEIPQLQQRQQRQRQAQANGNQPGQPPPGQPPAPGQMTPEMQRRLAQQNGPRPQEPLQELSQQKMLRAIYSDRQLQEVLTDFWFNHFNVDARKGRDRFLLTAYERDTIRPHVLGNFRELLEATAKSPAMLFYLDNWQSVDPNGPHPVAPMQQPGIVGRGGRFQIQFPRPQQQRPNQQNRGLNENYGRELMELHTLGVDGGYTQKDVTEVARAFTGWTIDNPRQDMRGMTAVGGGTGGFRFDPRLHDNREKTVLGHRIKAGGGIEDGERVLDILAEHPSTARFVATKLTRRFVSDEPPAALVDRVAATFRETHGDLRSVMRVILMSPEFHAPSAYRAKVKTPLEFIVSSVRATGAEVMNARPLVQQMQTLGMPLYQCQPPTGYKDTADAWANTGALVGRMNFAMTLATNRQLGGGPGTMAFGDRDMFIESVLGKNVSDTTRSTIAKAQSAPQMVALTLGSPEFQKH